MSAVNNEYNCLYVHNNSKKIVTVFIYEGFSPVCTFSSVSKILEPEQKCHHYIKERFKFEIFENKEKGTKEKCLGPEECNGIRVIKVSDGEHSLKCEQNTVNHDKKKIVRRVKRENDLPSGDLYAQLGLDMREVREMNEVERKKAIQKGFLKMILIWHPDKPNGDKEIADQLVQARNILLEDEMRAQYHNHIDIQQGWLSSRRWKAIFNPEMVTAEQKKAFIKRLAFLGLSSLLAVGGIAATVFTAGLAAPAFVILGAIAGGALTGAGLQSLGEAVSKESVVHGMDVKKWAKKALIGGVAGALAGGASGGITAAMVGIGSAALPSAAVSISQYVSMGAANGAIGGVMCSLSSDLAKKIVDEKDITLKQFLFHTLFGALIGATAGIAGGAVTEALVDSGSEAASPTLEGDAAEQFSGQASRKNIHDLARVVGKKATIEGAKSTANVPYKLADERLDSSIENRRLTTHLKEGAQNIFVNTARTSIINAVSEAQKLDPRDPDDGLQSRINGNSSNLSHGLDVNSDNGPQINDCVDGADEREGGVNEDEIVRCRENVESTRTNSEAEDCFVEIVGEFLSQIDLGNPFGVEHIERYTSSKQVLSKTIKYKSSGAWFSKMLVSYSLNGKKETIEESGDGKRVEISLNATDIEVKFQVWRPVWGDVIKYDRFKKKWSTPSEPHIFRYKEAVDRTFTLSGNLWFEAVMSVTDEYHEETEEL